MEKTKPIHAKPALYAFYYEVLKAIALKYGYNLVLHGSMNRDLDLIAIPWQEEIKPHQPMIEEMAECLGGYVMGVKGGQTVEAFEEFKKKFHGREAWIININRGITAKYDGMVPNFKEYDDPQYYIDISVLPVGSGINTGAKDLSTIWKSPKVKWPSIWWFIAMGLWIALGIYMSVNHCF